MMRKIYVVLLSVGLALFLFGCSKSDVEEEMAKNSDAMEDVAEENEDVKSSGIEIGDEIRNEHGVFTLLNRTSDLEEVEVAPVKVSVEGMGVASGEVADKFVDIIGKENLDYVQVDINAENISDEVIAFDLSKARMETNTGEEIDSSDMLLSDFVADEIHAGVKLNGSFIYTLEDSAAEDIESVRLIWDAPLDEDGEAMSEEVEIEIEF